MDCRDVRELADSFLSEQLLVETNHEVLGISRPARHAAPNWRRAARCARRLRARIRRRGGPERRALNSPRELAARLRPMASAHVQPCPAARCCSPGGRPPPASSLLREAEPWRCGGRARGPNSSRWPLQPPATIRTAPIQFRPGRTADLARRCRRDASACRTGRSHRSSCRRSHPPPRRSSAIPVSTRDIASATWSFATAAGDVVLVTRGDAPCGAQPSRPPDRRRGGVTSRPATLLPLSSADLPADEVLRLARAIAAATLDQHFSA